MGHFIVSKDRFITKPNPNMKKMSKVPTEPKVPWKIKATKVTNQNEKVFNFLKAYKREHDGNSPTQREIMDGCEISSLGVVKYYLKQLTDLNLIRLHDRSAAKIEIIGGRWVFIGDEHVRS